MSLTDTPWKPRRANRSAAVPEDLLASRPGLHGHDPRLCGDVTPGRHEIPAHRPSGGPAARGSTQEVNDR